MSLLQESLSIEDIKKITDTQKQKTIFSIIITSLVGGLVFYIVFVHFELSLFLSLTIVSLILFLFFIVEYSGSLNVHYDLIEDKKYVGNIIVVEKSVVCSNDSSSAWYIVKFDNWRIGEKAFKKEFWETINCGDILYINTV